MKFSSRNRDNDLYAGSCAKIYGGFWYRHCGGLEIKDRLNTGSILHLNDEWHDTVSVEMKFRPQNCDN